MSTAVSSVGALSRAIRMTRCVCLWKGAELAASTNNMRGDGVKEDPSSSKKLYRDTLGLPLKATEDYLSVEDKTLRVPSTSACGRSEWLHSRALARIPGLPTFPSRMRRSSSSWPMLHPCKQRLKR